MNTIAEEIESIKKAILQYNLELEAASDPTVQEQVSAIIEALFEQIVLLEGEEYYTRTSAIH